VSARTERWLEDYSEIGSCITAKPGAAEVKGKRKLSALSLPRLGMRSGRSFVGNQLPNSEQAEMMTPLEYDSDSKGI